MRHVGNASKRNTSSDRNNSLEDFPKGIQAETGGPAAADRIERIDFMSIMVLNS